MWFIGRQERMQERMRGAQRHQIEDDSFGFILPVDPVAADALGSGDDATRSKSSPDKAHSSPTSHRRAPISSVGHPRRSGSDISHASPASGKRISTLEPASEA